MMKRGFTLLEVMVALAVFAIAALAVVQATSGSLRSLNVLQDKMVAGWIADNKTALLYLNLPEKTTHAQHGEMEMAGSYWYWRCIPVTADSELLYAFDIEVSLSPDFRNVLSSRRAWLSNAAILDTFS